MWMRASYLFSHGYRECSYILDLLKHHSSLYNFVTLIIYLNISKFSAEPFFFENKFKTHILQLSRLKTTFYGCCSGNGPSGISLSYLLSGNWPYYTGESEDELLHTRLQQEPDLSLVEQDLAFLSDVSFYKI